MIGNCPHCGISLAALGAFHLGPLFVDKGGAFIWWKKVPIPLTLAEKLMVIALARAGGNPVGRHILAECAGSESDSPANAVAVMISRANRKFRAIDPAFDQIQSVRGMGLRWRPE